MPSLSIQLDDDIKTYLDATIQEGVFLSASELVAVALRNFRAEHDTQCAKLKALRRDISIGIEHAERCEFVEFDAKSIIAEAKARR